MSAIILYELLIKQKKTYFKNYALIREEITSKSNNDLQELDDFGRSLIFIAAQHGNENFLELLIKELNRRGKRLIF